MKSPVPQNARESETNGVSVPVPVSTPAPGKRIASLFRRRFRIPTYEIGGGWIPHPASDRSKLRPRVFGRDSVGPIWNHVMSIRAQPLRVGLGIPPQITTIGGMMMLIAVIALYAWCVRATTPDHAALPILLAFVVGCPTIGGPLLVKSRQLIKADPNFEPIDPDSDRMPQLVAESISRTVPTLEGLDFDCRGSFRHGLWPKCQRRTSRCSRIPRRVGLPSSSPFSPRRALVRQVVTVLAFRSEFTDGTWLITANSVVASLFPQSARRREGSFPSPGSRTRVGCTKSMRRAWSTTPPTAFPRPRTPRNRSNSSGNPLCAGTAFRRGRIRLPRRGSRGLSIHVASATLGAWKLTWPIKPIRQWLRRRRRSTFFANSARSTSGRWRKGGKCSRTFSGLCS